jgi:hypothetical protein
MTQQLRKFLLTTHVVTSVGWFGAAAAYAALVGSALAADDVQAVREAAVTIRPIMWLAIVPLALASLVTGVIQSLATSWGLVRHYWVIFKLCLTVFATAVLFGNSRTVNALAEAAASGSADATALRGQLVHASLGMSLLLLTTVLGIYKPRGLTRYGWSKQHGRTLRA